MTDGRTDRRTQPFIVKDISLSLKKNLFFFRTPKSRYLSNDGKKTTDSASYIKISLISNMDVTERFWSYGFVEWIAECGGFGGLFLGYSFSQIGDFIELVTGTFNKYMLK